MDDKEQVAELKKWLRRWGYVIPEDARFWKCKKAEGPDVYGMQIGHLWHSCHVDSSEIFVLITADNKGNKIFDEWDMWLTEVKM